LERIVKKTIISLSVIVLGFSGLSGCANMSETQQTTGTGAAIGAVAGALLGGGNNRVTGAAIGAAVGAGGGYLWSKHMEDQKVAMEKATQGSGVSVSQTADNQLKLDIPSDVSFDTGRHDIKSNLRPILDRFSTTLNQNPVTTVTIIGHTDSTGTDAINDPLSLNRAASTRDYLLDRGVATHRIVINGRGSHQPIANNDTIEGRAKNRRVEIFVAEPTR
jgi:outer membrane protein OmpA-like peptidoglycan-associated protein